MKTNNVLLVAALVAALGAPGLAAASGTQDM